MGQGRHFPPEKKHKWFTLQYTNRWLKDIFDWFCGFALYNIMCVHTLGVMALMLACVHADKSQ